LRTAQRSGVAAAAVLWAVAVAAAALPAAAQVTFSVAAAPFVGKHAGVVGETHVGGIPVGIVDFDARARGIELHVEGMPYARTRRYGDPFDPSRSTIETGDATVRLYTSPHLAFGIGYGVIASTTDRIAPPGSFTSFADGVRLELHEAFDVTPNARLEATLGGLLQAHGTLHVYPGIPGARDRYDAAAGTQIDAEIRYIALAHGPVSLGYGVRYVNQTIRYARSTSLIDRNAGILPFVQLNVRL